MPSATCTQAQKAKRLQALRAYKAKMGSARRAYFRRHRTAKTRKAFVKRQQAKLRALRRAASCTVPASEPEGADLSITMEPAEIHPPVGAALDFTITIRNLGPAPASEVTVVDQLPSALTYLSATASQGACAGTVQVSCVLGHMDNEADATVTLRLWTSSPGIATHTAAVSSTTSGDFGGNNAAASTMLITGSCDPSYPTVCFAPPPPDLDCGEVPFTNFQVNQPDPHGFDSDSNGVGCEASNARRLATDE